jgi:hypothetical protein
MQSAVIDIVATTDRATRYAFAMLQSIGGLGVRVLRGVGGRGLADETSAGRQCIIGLWSVSVLGLRAFGTGSRMGCRAERNSDARECPGRFVAQDLVGLRARPRPSLARLSQQPDLGRYRLPVLRQPQSVRHQLPRQVLSPRRGRVALYEERRCSTRGGRCEHRAHRVVAVRDRSPARVARQRPRSHPPADPLPILRASSDGGRIFTRRSSSRNRGRVASHAKRLAVP